MKSIVRIIFFILSYQFSYAAHTATEINDGAQIWRENCAICHGADGQGTAKIKEQLHGEIVDFTSLAFAESTGRKRMLLAIRDGVKDSIMPSFRETLNYQQMLAVADYASENFIMNLTVSEEYQAGKKVFSDNCSVCHGDVGQGAIWTASGLFPKPANFTDEKKIAELTRSRMIFSVTNGRPETAMVSWSTRLSKDQILAVVGYIRAAIMKVSDVETSFGSAMGQTQDKLDPFLSSDKFIENDTGYKAESNNSAVIEDTMAKIKGNDPFLESSAYQVSEDPNIRQENIYAGEAHDHQAHMGKTLNILDPLPNDLVGNYDMGRELYKETCASCHGVKGDGQGPRSYFIFPKPRNFTHSAARASFSRAHIYERIRTGVARTEMPAWGTVLEAQQMANVAEYVFLTFISQERIDPDFWVKPVAKRKD